MNVKQISLELKYNTLMKCRDKRRDIEDPIIQHIQCMKNQ